MIDSTTQLIGLIGNPIKHSKSPEMHNAMFEKLNLNYRYLAFEVEEPQLKAAINGMKALGIRGFNVTIPYKVKVMDFLDEISEQAMEIGAVNTVVNQQGKLIGYNTDGEGYVRSLLEETGIDLNNKKILILGAGGAAKAIAYSIAKYPIKKLTIYSRNISKGNLLFEALKQKTTVELIDDNQLKSLVEQSDIIINTTPVGMSPNILDSLINPKWLNEQQVVSDIIYNPLETQLLKDAKSKQATIHTGLGMFIYQGLIAFEKWTEITPDADQMRKIVMESLK